MQARLVISSIALVLLSPLLAACNEESQDPEAGDVIQARVDNQFKEGEEAAVALPTGRLLIHAAEPVDSAAADETRIRETVAAPSGAVLVPITWQYDPWASNRLAGFLATTDTPRVELVTDVETYRLSPPDPQRRESESFYVVVDGEAEERTLEIDFDGVTQTIDLTNGRIDKGEAESLYDIGEDRLRKKPCDDGPWFDSRTVAAEFTCQLVGPVLTPYAGGEWAPAGSTWLALTLETEMRIYGETNRLGGGARYVAKSVKVKAEIDDEKPAFELSTNDASDTCPVTVTATCGWSRHLIFEVPADDGEQGPLDVRVTYRLDRVTNWSGYDPPRRKKVTAADELKLWPTKSKR